ncbi:hypothetical protein [Paenibacillus senegalensis]|uniref:hypothetical protein n=1 Tax=Paenibacillus senegalensis TaxID=1465766 RepID=UPI000288BC4A|nr:hypothetical protein [Paenibacillus senegalensis]
MSFYRFSTVIGVGFTLLAILILMLQDTLLRISLDLPVLQRFALLEGFPLSAAGIGIFLLIVIPLAVIRLLTKRMPIRM